MGTQLLNGPTPQSPRQRGRAATRISRRLAPALGRMLLLLALPLVVFIAAVAQPAGVRASQQVARSQAAALSGSNATLSVSPLSGPVGVHLGATGSRFKPNDPIQIGYSTDSTCSSMTAISGAKGTAGSDGSLAVAVTWPQTSVGNYTICAQDISTNHITTGSSPFSVLSATPATLTISSPVKSQGQVTVTGANFLPGGTAVEVFYGLGGSTSQSTGSASTPICTQSAGTKTADAKGGFTLTFQAPFVTANSPVTVTAVSPQATCGGTPVLMAVKTVTVLAASSATATATATATTQTDTLLGSTNQIWPPSGIWSVVDCLVGLLLFLLLLLALLVASRNRGRASGQGAQSSSASPNQGPRAGGRLIGKTNVSVGPDGQPVASEQILAQGRRGTPVHVANVEDTVEEEPMPQLTPSSGQNPPTPRYGPPQY